MANSDKNILITPNIGSTTADPKIVFSGANATVGPQNITLQVYPTNNGTLSFDGSAGQLFSIANSLSGTIFSVNDVSGIPSIEVLDTGLVKLAEYNGNVILGTGADDGSKLQVKGSATITGSVSIAGNTTLHAGNYSNYALPLSGGTVSGYTTFSADVNMTSTSSYLPGHFFTNTLDGSNVYFHVGGQTSTTNKVLNLRIMTSTGGMSVYQFDVNRLSAPNLQINGNQVLHGGNYTSYSPSLTGSGASGSWGISITGSSASTTGNAATATTLQTARTINGVSFNGSANITVADATKLPLTGGTLTGKLTAGSATGDSIEISNDTASVTSNSFITFKNKNGVNVYRSAARISGTNPDNGANGTLLVETYAGGIAYKGLLVDENSNVWFYNTAGATKFQWDSSNVRALINSNIVLHAGNYSSYSPTLTGTGASGNWPITVSGATQTIDLSSLDQATYYPVTITILAGKPTRMRLNNALNAGGTNPGWSTHPGGFSLGLEWTVNGSGYGTIGVSRYISRYAESWTNVQIVGGISQMGNSSNEVVWLRGGGRYLFESDSQVTATVRTSTYTTLDQTVAPSTTVVNNLLFQGTAIFSVGNMYVSNNQVLHAGNYNSYSPTLTGTGASGSWGISVTGSAGSISGFNNPVTAATANTIAYRNADGDLAVRELVMGVAVQEFTPSSLVAIFPTTNQAVKVNATGARAFLDVPTRGGLNASGTWGISVTGSAGSAPANGGTATALNSSNYISRTGTSGNANTDFSNTPAGSVRHHGDDSSVTNGPGGVWWFYNHYRHSNGSNVWGTQVAWGWEDNSNSLAQRNVSGGTWSGWVRYLNSGNYNSYSPTLTGTGASGTWGINITGSAGSISNFTTTTSTTLGTDNATSAIGYIDSISLLGQTDGALYSHVYSTSWKHNIYGDYRTGQLAVRGKNSGTWQAWRIVLDSSNYTSYAMRYVPRQSADVNNSIDPGSWGINFDNPNRPVDYGAVIVGRSADVIAQWYGDHLNRFYVRGGNPPNAGGGGTWQSWRELVHAGNYGSYSPTLTGIGATGNWVINITGNAATATTLQTIRTINGTNFNGSASITTANWGTARTLTVGGTGKSVDGSANVAWTVAEVIPATTALSVASLTASGNVTAYSDERLKKDWQPLASNFVQQLAQVKSGTYTRTDTGEQQAGSSAQDWQQLLPEVVTVGTDDSKTLALAYGNAALVSAIELAKDNLELRARIERLESLIQQLLNKE